MTQPVHKAIRHIKWCRVGEHQDVPSHDQTSQHSQAQPLEDRITIHCWWLHARQCNIVEVELWVAWWRVVAVILETVEVLVSLATYFTAVWLLLFHANGAGIRNGRDRVYNRERAIAVLFQLL